MLTSIVAAAFILALLIVVHEAGHFAMAKRLGVRVIRFSIGYPPKIWGIRRGETEYSIGATPFGGYVRMLGEEVGEEPRSEELENYVRELALDVLDSARQHKAAALTSNNPDREIEAIAKRLGENDSQALQWLGRPLDPAEADVLAEVRRHDSLAEARKALAEHPTPPILSSFHKTAFPTQSLWKRFAIVLAGPLSNIAFAPILMTIVFLWGVPTLLPIVGQAKEGLPAHAAGVRPGDTILSVNGQPTETWNHFSIAVKSSGGSPITLEIQRGTGTSSTRQTVVINPRREDEPTVYGNKVPTWIIGVTPRGDEINKRYGPISAVEHGTVETYEMAQALIIGMWQIVDGSTPVRSALGGPIMIAQMAGKEAHEGFASLMMFTVMLSLELGIINLFPVPLLDGGHLLFFACEGVRGKPLNLRTRELALQVGLLLLVALMAFVIFNDISRIVQG